MIPLHDKSIFENRKSLFVKQGLIDRHFKYGDFKWQKSHYCNTAELPPQPLCCEYASWESSDDYYYFKRINQDYLSVDFVMEGQLYFRQGNEAYVAQGGDVVILHPHFDTYLMHLDQTAVRICGFCLKGFLLPELLKKLGLENVCGFPVKDRTAFQRCCRTLFRSMKSCGTAEGRLKIAGNAFELLCRLSHENQTVSPDDLAERLESYLRKSISTKIQISALPAQFNVSLPTLNDRFYRTYHQTPLQYLKHLRLEHAFQLLQSPACSIKEAAFACGFSSPQSFCKDFLKQTGITPGKFQASVSAAPQNPDFTK